MRANLRQKVRRTAGALRRALRDRKGGIAPIFAIAAVPLVLATGVGLDVSRVVSSRNNLQDAVDSAGLALGRMSPATDVATLQSKAQQWVQANATDGGLGAIQVSVSKSLGVVQVDATSQVSPTLAAMAHLGPFPVQAHSTVKYGLSHVELALVLDNTGSMADDNKLASLKTAATTLVNTLYASAQATGSPDALKVAVVPFSVSVNVGSTYQGSSWLTGVQPAAYGADIFNQGGVDRFQLLKALNNTKWAGCVESRPMPYDVQDTTPNTANPATLFVPYFAPDEPDQNTFNYYGYRIGYANNYLTDQPGDTTFAAMQGDPAKYHGAPRTGQDLESPYPIGPNSGCGTAAMLPLTTDMGAVTAELGKMVANGNTHIPIGLVWGWNLLSPNMPFGASPYGTANLIKIVVLVTDGANTYAQDNTPGTNGQINDRICSGGSGNYYYCAGTSGSPADNGSEYTGYGYAWQKRIKTDAGSYNDPVTAMNNRLSKLCANMQTAGIVMYTVPVEVTDQNIKSLLQNCATSPSNYIDVSNSSQLASAFNNIAGSIGNLRISH